ncbi:hypothetical protein CesoFtcFv8_019279 [Champsocephalus esox]|uniref:Uncharacterized protein n=1 Tax=Champsocephalus esox TaxID=159716 RepID=A0AAN8BI06_9TELE|nr:hypothetical protein CesoFtcFv8_019279 [Champsocephalus esox]
MQVGGQGRSRAGFMRTGAAGIFFLPKTKKRAQGQGEFSAACRGGRRPRGGVREPCGGRRGRQGAAVGSAHQQQGAQARQSRVGDAHAPRRCAGAAEGPGGMLAAGRLGRERGAEPGPGGLGSGQSAAKEGHVRPGIAALRAGSGASTRGRLSRGQRGRSGLSITAAAGPARRSRSGARQGWAGGRARARVTVGA